jgi:hypothetical protein
MKKSNSLLISILFLLFSRVAHAQIGLGGFDAVMTIPTARLLPDGQAALGFGYIPRPYGLFEAPDHDNLTYFAAIGFLPFAEIGIRSTLSIDTEYSSLGDRVLSMRVQFLKETPRRPAFVIGLHDIAALVDLEEGANNWFSALYLVASKTRNLSNHVNLDATLGYGVDWITAPSHEFDGLFGGLSVGFHNALFIKSEYDARRFNFGFGLKMKEFVSANLVLMNGNEIAFGANIRTGL